MLELLPRISTTYLYNRRLENDTLGLQFFFLSHYHQSVPMRRVYSILNVYRTEC